MSDDPRREDEFVVLIQDAVCFFFICIIAPGADTILYKYGNNTNTIDSDIVAKQTY